MWNIGWREYHDRTKHTAEALRRSRHFLDWVNMPDPFRHYEGAPLLDLPADPPEPASAAPDAHTFLSQLLYYSAAVSASKVSGTGGRYALRVNPSSGNLHPTEFHFVTRGLNAAGTEGWPDGLYHYRPSSHMAEQRAAGSMEPLVPHSSAPLVFILTSIAWREAWKYRDRAYRYCLLDMGHAWQALALAAKAMGCETRAIGHFADGEIADSCRLSKDEWPMLIVEIERPAGITGASGILFWTEGEANRLSPHQVGYPLIDEIHNLTTHLVTGRKLEPKQEAGEHFPLPPPAVSARPFGETVRGRRSALDFRGGGQGMSLPQLSAILAASSEPLSADFADHSFVQLYLYVHRVEGLEPGVYRYWPQNAQLELLQAGDQRIAAAGLSLGQDLAGNACVAFSMAADMERAVLAHGNRGYRYVYFEAGAIGQRLYVAAESLGLRATGIGAFFDDSVHSYLNLPSSRGQVIYHFAIGHAVPDPRIEA